jgi:MFS family permease
MVFGFFTVVIGKLFFPPTLPDSVKMFQAFALYSLGFLLRPVSGSIIGHLGDKLGRKKLFMITVFLMAVPKTLIGLLPTYATIGIAAPLILLLLRIVQGIAVAGASVFMTEHVPGSRLGFASGVVLGAIYIGFFLGAATARRCGSWTRSGPSPRHPSQRTIHHLHNERVRRQGETP